MFAEQFHHGSVAVNGTRLHYVEGGAGEPVLLLPGWPQSWYTWRYVMPQLVSAGRRVIAVDPRGMGDSAHPAEGYDMTSVAKDIHQLIAELNLGAVDVAGHDIGSWIGYALASDWPQDVKRLALFDAALPGITPPAPAGIPSAEANVKSWHFAFNRLDDLPEILINGRERPFLNWLFAAKATNFWAIDGADLEEYVRVNQLPGALRAALSYYRHAFSPQGVATAQQRATGKLTQPVLACGAEYGVGDVLINTLRSVADTVQGNVFAGVGHYIPEEAPSALVECLLAFYRSTER
ncbi:alpha/beta hydrolase [Winslowiella iniecta]|uniref:Alpha/beta hydrolase n=1 Tax=Winslowiella iniecta TaxID=1560201 RepID=A0A0L7T1E1_9GAMM|nr:alpha/beta hydrolase [Winslowiella iniecta]KOC91165.1 alpha/beta hydrolase [Winslowiella iniecta]